MSWIGLGDVAKNVVKIKNIDNHHNKCQIIIQWLNFFLMRAVVLLNSFPLAPC